MQALYDQIGGGYTAMRLPDQRIAAVIHSQLRGCRSVVNVGAGAGSYEPPNTDVVAVEPSWTMIRQRTSGLAPVVQAQAEALPFADKVFDAAMGILTLHHWTDKKKGLAECARCARRRLVFFTVDMLVLRKRSWLLRDYFPEILEHDEQIFPSIDFFRHMFREVTVKYVPVPADCSDGFLEAYWRRPEAYLNAGVRSAISGFSKIRCVDDGLARLREDLSSGRWEKRNGVLTQLPALDLGYCVVSVTLP
jgi:SAM-dependent methyltransferase